MVLQNLQCGDGSVSMQAFDIHDTYINVVIPFNKDIVSQMSDGKNNGKNNGKNDGKNLFNNDLSENEKRVLLELINNPSIPCDTLVVELKISRRTVSRVFESLVKKWYIQRVGTNKKILSIFYLYISNFLKVSERPK